jgi:hypothetical protein
MAGCIGWPILSAQSAFEVHHPER